jgi:hypothetical protein
MEPSAIVWLLVLIRGNCCQMSMVQGALGGVIRKAPDRLCTVPAQPQAREPDASHPDGYEVEIVYEPPTPLDPPAAP